MKELAALVSNIENNVRKLVGQLENSKKEIEILREEIVNLRAETDDLKQRLLNREMQDFTFRLAETVESSSDSLSSGKKLNELIREIDKCILLLDE
jgi:regulator of replication initiation timing